MAAPRRTAIPSPLPPPTHACVHTAMRWSLDRAWDLKGANLGSTRTPDHSSNFHVIVLSPLLDRPDDILDLWVGRVAEHCDDLAQVLLRVLPCNDLLECANACAALALPVLWVGVHPLEHIECLGRVVERTLPFATSIQDSVTDRIGRDGTGRDGTDAMEEGC